MERHLVDLSVADDKTDGAFQRLLIIEKRDNEKLIGDNSSSSNGPVHPV